MCGRRQPVHELAIAESVVVVGARAHRRPPGHACGSGSDGCAGVVPDAFEFCFELATAGTPLEGATLEIERARPGRRTAAPAATDFDLDDPFLLCECGSADVELLSGRELSSPVASVEVGLTCAPPADAATTTARVSTVVRRPRPTTTRARPRHGHPHAHGHGHVDPTPRSAPTPRARGRGAGEERRARRTQPRLARRARRITALNLMSSPGRGKTTLLERTIARARPPGQR